MIPLTIIVLSVALICATTVSLYQHYIVISMMRREAKTQEKIYQALHFEKKKVSEKSVFLQETNKTLVIELAEADQIKSEKEILTSMYETLKKQMEGYKKNAVQLSLDEFLELSTKHNIPANAKNGEAFMKDVIDTIFFNLLPLL